MPMRYYPFYGQARKMLDAGRFGPPSHVDRRMNRFSPARYVTWDSAWMLDPAISGGGCLRNLGAHGFDMFHLLTGEDAEVTAAQTSRRARSQPIEDYVSVLIRSRSGVLGTLEIGTTYPRVTTAGEQKGPSRDKLLDGADSEWKVSGRDALLMAKDGELRIVTADAEETIPGTPDGSPSYRLLQEAIGCWQRGEPPPASVHDCYRAVQLIDRAYELAAG
jgi:predicted dehydrogenase